MEVIKSKEKVKDLFGAELNQKMIERGDVIDNATYRYLIELLDLREDEVQEKFPWNIEILRLAFENTVSVLNEYGYSICDPHIVDLEDGRQYCCIPSECGCKRCKCQDYATEEKDSV